MPKWVINLWKCPPKGVDVDLHRTLKNEHGKKRGQDQLRFELNDGYKVVENGTDFVTESSHAQSHKEDGNSIWNFEG